MRSDSQQLQWLGKDCTFRYPRRFLVKGVVSVSFLQSCAQLADLPPSWARAIFLYSLSYKNMLGLATLPSGEERSELCWAPRSVTNRGQPSTFTLKPSGTKLGSGFPAGSGASVQWTSGLWCSLLRFIYASAIFSSRLKSVFCDLCAICVKMSMWDIAGTNLVRRYTLSPCGVTCTEHERFRLAYCSLLKVFDTF